MTWAPLRPGPLKELKAALAVSVPLVVVEIFRFYTRLDLLVIPEYLLLAILFALLVQYLLRHRVPWPGRKRLGDDSFPCWLLPGTIIVAIPGFLFLMLFSIAVWSLDSGNWFVGLSSLVLSGAFLLATWLFWKGLIPFVLGLDARGVWFQSRYFGSDEPELIKKEGLEFRHMVGPIFGTYWRGRLPMPWLIVGRRKEFLAKAAKLGFEFGKR